MIAFHESSDNTQLGSEHVSNKFAWIREFEDKAEPDHLQLLLSSEFDCCQYRTVILGHRLLVSILGTMTICNKQADSQRQPGSKHRDRMLRVLAVQVQDNSEADLNLEKS